MPQVEIGLLNAEGQHLTMECDRPFDLVMLSLCALWMDARVVVEGWEKDSRKYDRSVPAQWQSLRRVTLEYRTVDRIMLSTDGAHILVNEISVRFPKTA